MKRSLLFSFFFCSFLLAYTQAPLTSADIYLGLRKLNVLGSVLYVAAHPDDENTRLITYFSKDRLYRTGYLSLTRGDGGQNLIGDEQGIELGLIRTQELLSARRIDGGEQFFTRAFDFGFSKNPQETFTKWDKEQILADVVYVIRKFQPDVIITRFPTTGEGGHGHHTASAILANEAFSAAADPARFPEQLKRVQPWQAKRILWNTFNFGNTNTQRDDQFKFDVGGYNPVLGKSYGEIAADSRSQHKSQGFGVPRSRGEALEFFKTTGGDVPATDLFENIATDWKRVKDSEKAAMAIGAAIASFDFMQPQKSVLQLVQIYKALLGMQESYWRNQKLFETKNLIEAASGLWTEAFVTQQYAVQGDSLRFNVVLNNRLGTNVSIKKISMETFDTTLKTSLPPNKNITINKSLLVPAGKELTQPYWLKQKMKEGYYSVTDQRLIGEPDVEPAFSVVFDLAIEGQDFSFTKPVRYKYTDPVKGEVYQPVTVLPPLSLSMHPALVIFKKGDNNGAKIGVVAKANKHLPYKKSVFSVQPLQNVVPPRMDTSGSWQKNEIRQYEFSVLPKNIKKEGETGVVEVAMDAAAQQKFPALSTINYDHIPSINYFYQDEVKFIPVDLKTAGKKIGYITGAGDKVPEALESMGYEVSILSDKELSRTNLAHFDAIITGVRAYNTAEWLPAHYTKLMRYVENGGNLIVQYNTSNQLGAVKSKIGPYPFAISRNRVTDETAVVAFIRPEHPVLNYPNKISGEDFRGWVQERSIYDATEMHSSFEPVLRMNDPGEAPDEGSLIIAKHGRGFFTYTGLVFFRQLPAGVPGAYRLMANLIALNQKKEM